MSYRHTAKRRDANEQLVVDALRAVGATVQRLDGKGVPDLLVGYQGKTYLLEVKNPENTKGALAGEKRTKGRAVRTAEQVEWFAAWKGAPVVEVINADEALVAIGALRALTLDEVKDALQAGARESAAAAPRLLARRGRYR